MSDNRWDHDSLIAKISRTDQRVENIEKKVEELHEVIFCAGNGGINGWMHKLKGQVGMMAAGISVFVSIFVTGLAAWIRSLLQ